MSRRKETICVLDDDPSFSQFIADILNQDYTVVQASNYHDFLNSLPEYNYSLILCDLFLKDKKGTDLIDHFREFLPRCPVIMITASKEVQWAVKALKSGAFDYLTKPVNIDELQHVVEKALAFSRLQNENIDLKWRLNRPPQFSKLVGESAAMNAVFSTIEKVSKTTVPVLITGESGTGKELVAKAIHDSGPRKGRPFIPINFSAIPVELIESEFFGHSKGAFTGAIQNRTGLFEEADGGTLFLDEIGDMAPSLQTKLLRVIQEGEVKVVGENKQKPVDVRIISATHRLLTREIAVGRFREDLYYRISVINIHLPALRERAEDIPLLMDHFLEAFASSQGLPPKKMEPKAVQRLMSHPWKGNIRELQNVLAKSFVLCESDTIGLDDIAFNQNLEYVFGHQNQLSSAVVPLREVEKYYIQHALKVMDFNKDRTAKALKIDRKTLYKKLHDIELEGVHI